MIELLNWIFFSGWHFFGFLFLAWMLCYMLVVIPFTVLGTMHTNKCTVKINEQKLEQKRLDKADGNAKQ